jgi:site-specific DNA recombinase
MYGLDLRGKRVGMYGRYSSGLQRESSLEDQKRVCGSFAAQCSGCLSEELVCMDSAISGASLERPGFERLMKLAGQGLVDVILTEDLSRITRDFGDAGMIFKQLQFLGVPLIGVSDGIDTSSKQGKLSYQLKAVMNEVYLDDLRAKTIRGLDGRALAGFSTGGLPFGYTSKPITDSYGKVTGHEILIDQEQAELVRRIYNLYLQGNSLDSIARKLNTEQVPPPRAKSRHRRKGWVAGTIHAFLRNEAYTGKWAYKKRQWFKVPGTNIRRPRPRQASEVLHFDRPELRIIEPELWEAVQARLVAVAAHYKPKNKIDAKGDGPLLRRGFPGHPPTHALSGVLTCGVCGAPMIITGGSSARYYRCGDHKKRGNCPNKLSVKEEIARTCIFNAIRNHFSSAAAVDFVRHEIADELGKMNRELAAALKHHGELLARTETRIGGLIEFISRGDQSDYIRQTLVDLEAQAKVEKNAIEALKRQAAKPIQLPSPEELMDVAYNLEKLALADPALGREELRKMFDQGHIVLLPQPDGYYLAKSKIFPLVPRLDPRYTNAPSGEDGAWYGVSCAGWI